MWLLMMIAIGMPTLCEYSSKALMSSSVILIVNIFSFFLVICLVKSYTKTIAHLRTMLLGFTTKLKLKGYPPKILMKFLVRCLTFALLCCSLSLTLAACQSAKDLNQQAIIEFIHSTFPTNPQVWVQSLAPNVANNYRTALQQELARQFGECEKCSFTLERLKLKRQDSTWQVEMFGRIDRLSAGEAMPFSKTLFVKEIRSAKEPQYVIQSIKNIED